MKNNFWKIIGEDFNSPFIRNYIWTSAFYDYPKLFKLSKFFVGIEQVKNKINYITNSDSWDRCHKALVAQVNLNYNLVEKIIDKTEEKGKNFSAWVKKNIQDCSDWSNVKILKIYKQFCQRQSEIYAWGVLVPILDFQGFSFVEKKLENFLQKNTSSSEEYKKAHEVFSAPTYHSFAMEQEINLLKLISEFYDDSGWRNLVEKGEWNKLEKQYPTFFRKLKRHTDKYAWIYYVYAGPALTINDFLLMIKDSIKSGTPKDKLKEINDRQKTLIKVKNDYLKKLKPNKFYKMILTLAGKMVWAKPRRKDYQSQGYYHLEKLQREIGKRLSLSLSQVRSLSLEMLEKYLLKGVEVDVETLNQIASYNICIPSLKDKNTKILYGQEAQDFGKNILRPKISDFKSVDELRGSCAYPGKVVGKVSIINCLEDSGKMVEGNVLVSVATTPAIVPAMKKAVAIVTNEGGLTCHASIVSREFKIPCVVGTKIATEVLKDGDWVEVDANNGIIKKI